MVYPGRGPMLGRTLAHYRIVDRLGAGGMGEVFRAVDLKLDRHVALKVLPADFARDPARLERFRQEARAVAALNHPNIVTLYSVEESDGIHFLTMELVEGQTLDHVLPANGLPPRRFFELALPLAAALAAAHRHGVVHRDLKPRNVMVGGEGGLKVLDFGLAKLIQPAGADPSVAPTAAATAEGSLLGTVPYMAPEQLEGRPADRRSDLFSLGVLLYQMATGRHPFSGGSSAVLIASILRDTPAPVYASRPDLPLELDRLIARCLEKDPERRWADAGELSRELETLGGTGSPSGPAIRTRPLRLLGIGALVLVALATWLVLARRPRPTTSGSDTSGSTKPRILAQITFGRGVEGAPAWSPDGTRLLYSGEAGGFQKLFLRTEATGEEHPLTTGRQDDLQPAWSPDGGSVAFVRANTAGGKLEPSDVLGWYSTGGDVWIVEVATGAERKLFDNAFNPSFGADGALAFDAAWAGPHRVWVTDFRRLNARSVSSDTSEAVVHTSPRWSPDGKRLLFRRIEKTKSDIQVLDLAAQRAEWITNDHFPDMDPAWAPSGRHVWYSSARGGGLNLWRAPVGPDGLPAGPAEQITTGAGSDIQVAPAPGGTRVAFAVLQLNADVFRLPLDPRTGAATGPPEAVVATTREDSRAAWSPDGSALAFNSDRGGEMNLWTQPAAGGAARQVTRGSGGDYQANWSPDGRALTFFSARSGNADIWSVDVASGGLTQLTTDPGLDINPFYSPDGRHIAFQSDRDGRLEVWVMDADGSAQRRLTSVGAGGHFLRWSADGRTLVFRSDAAQRTTIYRLDVQSGALTELRPVESGGHLSFNPTQSSILDVAGHKSLRVFPLSGEARVVFEFDDPQVRIDYPVWSPDGRFAVFDRVAPQGGDVWMLGGLGD